MPDRLIGREAEIAACARFLDAVAEGCPALLIEGEPGIGKTTVWETAVDAAASRSIRVLACRPAEADTGLAFTGLTDLMAEIDDAVLAGLPGPQRRALEIALLRADHGGGSADHRAVYMGLLSTLTRLAEEMPVLVAIDDVQWLDQPSARAVSFAARRFGDARVGVLGAARTRETGAAAAADGALLDRFSERLELGPVSLATLYQLLRTRLQVTFPRPVLLRIAEASGGNPLYALEIARAVQCVGAPPPAEALPIPSNLQQLVTARIERLPAATRDELEVAAALSQPTTAQVDRDRLRPAEGAGLVRVGDGGRIAFSHPVFASAVYATVREERRTELHRRLAELVTDVEERARHLIRASAGPDEQLALVLDEAADHAARRGAPESAGELEEEAAHRSAAARGRWPRLLHAASYCIQAGDGDRARELAEEVIVGEPPAALRARAFQILAETCYRDRLPESRPLLEQALELSDDDVSASEIELNLAFLAIATGDGPAAEAHAQRSAELAERAGQTALLAEALAMGQVASFYLSKGFDDAVVDRALVLEDLEHRVPLQLRPSMNVAQLYEWSCRFDQALALFAALRDRILDHGEESDLPFVLVHLGACHMFLGHLAAAEQYANEALAAAELVESEVMTAFAFAVRALTRARRGHAGAEADAMASLQASERVGWPHGVLAARWALGLVALGRGDRSEALEALEPVASTVEGLGLYDRLTAMYLPEAIEALVGSGERERADRLTRALADTGRRLDRAWSIAEAARCRALLSAAHGDLAEAQSAVDEALAQQERLAMPFERGRALLAKGMLCRRVKQKRAAREALEAAVGTFEDIGAVPWAAAARRELDRIGLRRAASGELTETEQRVAELAAAGLKNREIAAQAFLTPKSVEDVLRRVYRKLDIHSRAELGARMALTPGRR